MSVERTLVMVDVAVRDPTGVPNPAGGMFALSASTPGRVVRLVAEP